MKSLSQTGKGFNDDYILATDFNQVDREREEWMESREKLGNIYMAISEYIWYLQDLLTQEDDSYKKFLIEKEIKKLEKERMKYYVPSILEESKFELATNSVPRKDSLEKSKILLLKKK